MSATFVVPGSIRINGPYHEHLIVDNFSCKGCGRYICNEKHTKIKKEQISVVREGLRGHRYQVTSRYCELCAPISRVGGIKGLSYLVVVAGTVIAGIFFYFHP